MGTLGTLYGLKMTYHGLSFELVVSLLDKNENELAALPFGDTTKGILFIKDLLNRVLSPRDTSVWRPTFGVGPVRDESGRSSFMARVGVQVRF